MLKDALEFWGPFSVIVTLIVGALLLYLDKRYDGKYLDKKNLVDGEGRPKYASLHDVDRLGAKVDTYHTLQVQMDDRLGRIEHDGEMSRAVFAEQQKNVVEKLENFTDSVNRMTALVDDIAKTQIRQTAILETIMKGRDR